MTWVARKVGLRPLLQGNRVSVSCLVCGQEWWAIGAKTVRVARCPQCGLGQYQYPDGTMSFVAR